MAKKLTNEEFISKANKKHNGKYDYSKTIYKNKRTNIIITCPIHGDFEQNPEVHLRGSGCPKCGKCDWTSIRNFNLNFLCHIINMTEVRPL